MKNPDPRVDAYIEKAADFAQPILEKIRKAAHKAWPDIEEGMKWSSPAFLCNGIVAGVSAHKAHVRIGFWKGSLLKTELRGFAQLGDSDIHGGNFSDAKELPTQKDLVAAFKEAVRLNLDGVKPAKKKTTKKKKPAPRAPADLMALLKKNKQALATFEGFSPSHKREYIEWITEAKREATREKRLHQAIEWMADGKPRNWKYMNC